MVVSPDDKNKEEAITQLEKEKVQMEKSLGNIERRIKELKLGSSSSSGKEGGSSSNESPSRKSQRRQKNKGKKAPTQTVPKNEEIQPKVKAETAPKVTPTPRKETFAEVTRKRGKKKEATSFSSAPSTPKSGGSKATNKPPTSPQNKAKKKKPPKTAAVVITCQDGAYERKLREVKSKINLVDLGIDGLKPRKAITGGYVFEVAGEDRSAKADKLAAKLRDVIGGEGVKITRPCKTVKLRLKGLDASITPSEVREALARKGQCNPEEIQIGVIRRFPDGLGTIWARCPLIPANKVAEFGKIQIEWSVVRAEILTDRPLQWYKCLEGGTWRRAAQTTLTIAINATGVAKQTIAQRGVPMRYTVPCTLNLNFPPNIRWEARPAKQQ